MKFSTAVACLFSACVLMVLSSSSAAQQAYPSKPIRYIIPYPPGGGSDVLARLITQKLAEHLGTQVIVDNRGGGNTIIGSEALVKSAPDGYTLLQSALPHIITPLLLPTPFDAIKDFAPVATLIKSEFVLVVHPSVAATNLQEFIALAKTKPGQLNYSSAGVGSAGHLGLELFGMMTGVKLQHVPYKGTAQAVSDTIGGQVQVLLATPISALPHVKTGKLRALAYSGETRWAALPQVPTFAERGVQDFDVKNWYGIFAPVGTPRAIIDRLSAEVAKIVMLPDVKEKLASQGMEPFISTPEQFGAMMQAGTARLAKVIKASNIKFQE